MPRAAGALALPMLLTAIALWNGSAAQANDASPRPPNLVVILCDNLGYGDIGCFGATGQRTPRIDRMATEGLRLTDFYVASGVCTPSRAAIMTGCYPRRVNMHLSDTGGAVLQPVSPKGLHPDEVTIAEVLHARGYATAIVGKWHLGDQPELLPTRQGFDHYFGIPYSDDMTAREGRPWPPLPLMRQEVVVEAPADRDTLTQRYTEDVVDFIRAHREQPFFVLFSHAMPGSTRHPHASEAFRGRSQNGAWGDSIEEIDWSTGVVLDELAALGLDEQTLVIWTSDNGAPQRSPMQGSNLPLSGWGYGTSEGGMRVPCVVRWPGHVPSGAASGELTTAMDLLPTFAALAGAELPSDRTIDGHDIRPILFGEELAVSPYDAFFFYDMEQLHAVRSGRWKLYLPLETKYTRGRPGPASPMQLFDLVKDPSETREVPTADLGAAIAHLNVIEMLMAHAEAAREELGDHDRPGRGQRPAANLEEVTPRVAPSW